MTSRAIALASAEAPGSLIDTRVEHGSPENGIAFLLRCTACGDERHLADFECA
jgi:hypothetical protein